MFTHVHLLNLLPFFVAASPPNLPQLEKTELSYELFLFRCCCESPVPCQVAKRPRPKPFRPLQMMARSCLPWVRPTTRDDASCAAVNFVKENTPSSRHRTSPIRVYWVMGQPSVRCGPSVSSLNDLRRHSHHGNDAAVFGRT